ncbi:hypothetical protein WBK50_27375 [Pseudonocardia sp. T1-2H]|uniref:hypothetical protein n=1 Tax=Pseudonocardia sp. T1-2H TaxID=3128899 RepID=UPI0031017006
MEDPLRGDPPARPEHLGRGQVVVGDEDVPRRPGTRSPISWSRPSSRAGVAVAARTAAPSPTPLPRTTWRRTSTKRAVPPAIERSVPAPASRATRSTTSTRIEPSEYPPSGIPAAAMASVTSAIRSGPTRSNTIATVSSARWTPSATSSTTISPRPAAARHAAAGPGARWCSSGMPLNRWVALTVAPPASAIAAVVRPAAASVWPRLGSTPCRTRIASSSR